MLERASEFGQSEGSNDVGLRQLIHSPCQSDVCSHMYHDMDFFCQTGSVFWRYPQARQREITVDCNDLVHRLDCASAWCQILAPRSFQAILRVVSANDGVDFGDRSRPQQLFDDSEAKASTAMIAKSAFDNKHTFTEQKLHSRRACNQHRFPGKEI